MTAPAAHWEQQSALAAPPQVALTRSLPLLTASGKPTSPAIEHIFSAPTGIPNVSGHRGKEHRRSKSLRTPTSTSSCSYAGLTAGTPNSFGHALRRTLTTVKSSGSALKRSLSSTRNRAAAEASKGYGGPGSTVVASDVGGAPRRGRSFSENLRNVRFIVDREALTDTSNSLSSGISEAPPRHSQQTPKMVDKSGNRVEGVVDATPRDQADVKVPLLLQEGVPMYKVSAKKKKMVPFRIDADEGCILWESKNSGIIPIECIKEIRSGVDGRYYREQFQLSVNYEERWITIVYIIDGSYKTLHLVAPTIDVFTQWDTSLRALYAVRQALMSGLGHGETRQSIWEKRYWKSSDEQRDDKLVFEEVEKMCLRLNLTLSKADLLARFKEADTQSRGFLDFNDFRLFVKSLKARPDITRRYRELAGDGQFTFDVFENFMKTTQKSSMNRDELSAVFKRHASHSNSKNDKGSGRVESTPVLPSEPSSSPKSTDLPAVNDSNATLANTANSEDGSPAHSSTPEEPLTMSLDAFTTFLLSPDNSASSDKDGQIWQDMTRPLPEYFISSSHNTYLVGHQLVGVSTIEGYIRALLHSCRSVEIDVYDGEVEPVIFHGKTFTSKVPLRDICEAVHKYAFVASPYPVIISAEVHCSVPQQDKFASIMHEIFGDALVSAPPEGRPPLDKLPSPEDLRGRILLKAKNLYVMDKDGGVKEKLGNMEAEGSSSSTSDTSASDSEFVQEIKGGLKHEFERARGMNAVKEIKEEIQKVKKGEPIRELKEELGKARTLYDKVRRRKSPSPAGSSAFPPTPGTPPARVGASNASLSPSERKVKMSFALVALLVYTVGVKCRGFNKKETYAPEHLFSLSESRANKFLKQSMADLIKHNRTHLVRIYPNGMRLNSSNYEPHKYWAAGCQLVAINWQTFDLGYMINHSMFQRNGRAGYVLKPPALREPNKELLSKLSHHQLEINIISAQQLPRRKDKEGREIIDDTVVDPFVEVSIHVPDWSRSPLSPNAFTSSNDGPLTNESELSTLSKLEKEFQSELLGTVSPNPNPISTSLSASSSSTITSKPPTARTTVIKNNGFNPIWEESLSVPFSVYGRMLELVFVRIVIRDERDDEKDEPLAVYCCPISCLGSGYRHLPLHDGQLSQYLFSTLFVHVNVRDV